MTNQNQPSEVKEGGALDLLPCPFCGKEAAMRESTGGAAVEFTPVYQAHCKYGECAETTWSSWRTDAVAEWNRRPPSMERGEAEGWRHPDDLPDVKPGQNAYRIVAVKRAHNGKVARFAAFYLNAEPLWFEDENESRPVTGWNADREGDDGPLYEPLLSEGDELMGWREFPAWEPAAPSPAPSVSPDEIKAAYMRGWNDRESDIIERAERILPAPSAVEMADLERDAARWRAFINCGHIKMQGWAACDTNGDRMPVEDRPVGSVHFGAEFWVNDGRDQLPTGATHDQAGRKVVTAFADDCIAAGLLALATASREKGSRAARELKPAADMSCADSSGVKP